MPNDIDDKIAYVKALGTAFRCIYGGAGHERIHDIVKCVGTVARGDRGVGNFYGRWDNQLSLNGRQFINSLTDRTKGVPLFEHVGLNSPCENGASWSHGKWNLPCSEPTCSIGIDVALPASPVEVIRQIESVQQALFTTFLIGSPKMSPWEAAAHIHQAVFTSLCNVPHVSALFRLSKDEEPVLLRTSLDSQPQGRPGSETEPSLASLHQQMREAVASLPTDPQTTAIPTTDVTQASLLNWLWSPNAVDEFYQRHNRNSDANPLTLEELASLLHLERVPGGLGLLSKLSQHIFYFLAPLATNATPGWILAGRLIGEGEHDGPESGRQLGLALLVPNLSDLACSLTAIIKSSSDLSWSNSLSDWQTILRTLMTKLTIPRRLLDAVTQRFCERISEQGKSGERRPLFCLKDPQSSSRPYCEWTHDKWFSGYTRTRVEDSYGDAMQVLLGPYEGFLLDRSSIRDIWSSVEESLAAKLNVGSRHLWVMHTISDDVGAPYGFNYVTTAKAAPVLAQEFTTQIWSRLKSLPTETNDWLHGRLIDIFRRIADALSQANDGKHSRNTTLTQLHRTYLEIFSTTNAENLPSNHDAFFADVAKRLPLEALKRLFVTTDGGETEAWNKFKDACQCATDYHFSNIQRCPHNFDGVVSQTFRSVLPGVAPSVLGDPRAMQHAKAAPHSRPETDMPSDFDSGVKAEIFFYVRNRRDYYAFPILVAHRLWGILAVQKRPYSEGKLEPLAAQIFKVVLHGNIAANVLGHRIGAFLHEIGQLRLQNKLFQSAGDPDKKQEDIIAIAHNSLQHFPAFMDSAPAAESYFDSKELSLAIEPDLNGDRLSFRIPICSSYAFDDAEYLRQIAKLSIENAVKRAEGAKRVLEATRSYEQVAHLSMVQRDFLELIDGLEKVRDITLRVRSHLSPAETGLLMRHPALDRLLSGGGRQLWFIGHDLKLPRTKEFSSLCDDYVEGTKEVPDKVRFDLKPASGEKPTQPFFEFETCHTQDRAETVWRDYRRVLFCLAEEWNVRFLKSLARVDVTADDSGLPSRLFAIFKLMVQRVHAPSYCPSRTDSWTQALLFDAQLLVTLFEWLNLTRENCELCLPETMGLSVGRADGGSRIIQKGTRYSSFLAALANSRLLKKNIDASSTPREWDTLKRQCVVLLEGIRPVNLLVPLQKLLIEELLGADANSSAYAKQVKLVDAKDGQLQVWIDISRAGSMNPWVWSWGEEARSHGFRGQLKAICDALGATGPSCVPTINNLSGEIGPVVFGAHLTEARLLIRLRRPQV